MDAYRSFERETAKMTFWVLILHSNSDLTTRMMKKRKLTGRSWED
jgi:hypothetical protein